MALADPDGPAFPRHDADRTILFQCGETNFGHGFKAVLAQGSLEVVIVEPLAFENVHLQTRSYK